MFKDSDYRKLEELGLIGLPLEHCGASLDMTRQEFIENYLEDKEARKAYERGQSAGAQAQLVKIMSKADKEWKAQQFLAEAFRLKVDPRKKDISDNVKKDSDEEDDDDFFDHLKSIE